MREQLRAPNLLSTSARGVKFNRPSLCITCGGVGVVHGANEGREADQRQKTGGENVSGARRKAVVGSTHLFCMA